MQIQKRAGLLLLAGLVALGVTSGCGNSSKTTNIPTSTTIFYAHSAIFRNSSTFTAGYNGFGQLGNGSLNDQAVFLPVAGLGRVQGVSTGGDHTLAFANNTSVYAWGSNYHGQIGPSITQSGSGAFRSTPIRVILTPGTPALPVTAVAAGGYHSLALVNGSVYAWGYNGYGQLGDGIGLVDKPSPAPVVGPTGPGSSLPPIKAIAAGGLHSLALSSDGQSIYAWGYNASGQAGGDPAAPGRTTIFTPNKVTFSGYSTPQIAKIAAGGGFSLALREGGKNLYLWGHELGDETVTGSTFLARRLLLPDAVNTVTAISAGQDHILILDDNGIVWAAGFNRYGQLGNGTIVSQPTNTGTTPFVKVELPALKSALEIIAFGLQSLAKLDDGSWYGWGNNGHGQLGNPISNSSIGYLTLPTRVQGL